MTNDEINQREWNDSKNWSCGLFYHSRTDCRAMVPKRCGFGRTVNFGNRNGVIIFVALLALPLVIFVVLYFLSRHSGRHV